MKFRFVIVLLALCLNACNVHRVHEKTAQSRAEQAGLVQVNKSQFDAAFLLPGANLNQYKKIILSNVDFSDVKIIKPSSSHAFQQTWELTNEDKQYYQEKFAAAAKNFLFDADDYSRATESASGTLVLKARITDIAPLASKDDFKSRPNLIDVYSEGFGRMTIVFELYDSVSNKLIFMSSDEHDLGNTWEKNDRLQNNVQVRLAFDYWLRSLSQELNAISKI